MRKALTVIALWCGAGGAGTVHDVRMLVTPDGAYVFEPDTLRVRVGDRVRWINVSGGPHNVAFYPEAVPPDARAFLERAMPSLIGDLTGELLFDDNAVYEIVFAGAPTGTYAYYCTPHELVGMQAWLMVEPSGLRGAGKR